MVIRWYIICVISYERDTSDCTAGFCNPVIIQRGCTTHFFVNFTQAARRTEKNKISKTLNLWKALSSKLGRIQPVTVSEPNLKTNKRNQRKLRQKVPFFVCLYCGHDITSLWNDVQKCNRTENGSDEVELSHRLAGLKTTQYKNRKQPRIKKNLIKNKHPCLLLSSHPFWSDNKYRYQPNTFGIMMSHTDTNNTI